jgi:putative redox protein
MAVEIEIVYEGRLYCGAVHGPSGATLRTTAPVDNGGTGDKFSPTDLVATALGTCMLTIMGIASDRIGIELTGTKVKVIKEMAAAPVRRIGRLAVTITLPSGLALSEKDRTILEDAARLCPVKQSLHPDVKVDTEFIIP